MSGFGQVRTVSMQWVDFMMMPLMPSLNNRYSLENIEPQLQYLNAVAIK